MKKGFLSHQIGAGAVLCLLAILWPVHTAQSITENYQTDVEVFKRITATRPEFLRFGTISTRFCFIGCTDFDGGTVTITPDRSIVTGICSAIGDFFFACQNNDFLQAKYIITGTPFAFYTAVLPSTLSLGPGLNIDQFRGVSQTWGILSSGTTVTGKFNLDGEDFLWVGARLAVPSGLLGKQYSAIFALVSVNYL